MIKLWSVKVNGNWDKPQTLFFESKEEANTISSKYECHDKVCYAGNFSDKNAKELLDQTSYYTCL